MSEPAPLRPWQPGFDFDAPACPDGMVAASPDFVGIGAQRSGTTWWFSLLNRHPAIHSARGYKELHFLSQFATRDPSPTDAVAYAAWFPRPPGAIAGEWTPYYMVHSWLGPVLARIAPAAKVVVILRDPVDRYVSGIARRQERRPGFGPDEETSQFLRGFYSEHLTRLEPYVADDAVLVLQYERCVREPQLELARTFRFLGVEPFEVPNVESRANARVEQPYELWRERRAMLVDAYRRDVEELAARHPEIDVALWKNFA